MRYILAFYELDRAFGGPEDGGWWFDTGTLIRVHAVEPSEDRAAALMARANRLIDRLQRGSRSLDFVLYSGGRHRMCVFQHTAPPHFPQGVPHYE